MKIIKRGDTAPWWTGKQAACWSCGTVVEFEATDELEEQERRPLLLASLIPAIVYVEAACPVCGATIELAWHDARAQAEANRAEVV